MSFVHDHENRRIISTETGEFLVWELADWQTNQNYFLVKNEDGAGLFGSLVQIKGWYSDESQKNAVVEYRLTRAWIPTGNQGPPRYFLDPSPYIENMAAFLRSYHHYSGVKIPDPEFRFVDARSQVEELQ